MNNKNFPGGRRRTKELYSKISWIKEHKEYPKTANVIQLQPEDITCNNCHLTMNLCKCAELEKKSTEYQPPKTESFSHPVIP